MLAELHNKVSGSSSNLTERSEDELTGNFFGTMRYMPFCKGLKKILMEGIYPEDLRNYIEDISLSEWADKIILWEKDKLEDGYTELDVKIEFEKILIGIEVKYLSGLSSDDEVFNQDEAYLLSSNQLAREARVLNQIGKEKQKLLLLLADELSCHDIVQNVKSRKIVENVELGYISWQSILTSLKKLNDLNSFEQVMANDLVCLLEKKGFERFKDFEMESCVENNSYWIFDGKVDIKFNFANMQNVKKGVYYEFK
ncbi:MAG: hypothetical protein H2184_13250 [Candidatus Galacturonibacter soehngenii]|nr:hypothetical protein [Candidatus Galacturonibacter soehngenii]